jgi:Asp-tRNA(Asn)/Glu-tRNA(Gln) amidotransferase A subunit family amidase
VARFEAAGLIPLGKTNVSEFGLLPLTEPKLYDHARNPWNLDQRWYRTGSPIAVSFIGDFRTPDSVHAASHQPPAFENLHIC